MYNRNEELNSLLNELNDLPENLHMDNIKKSVGRKVFVHRAVTTVRSMVVFFVFLMTAFIVGVNTVPVFAEAVSKVTFLRPLVEAVNFNEGYRDAIENEYITEVHQVKATQFGDIELAYFIADEKNMILFLKKDNIQENVNEEGMYVSIYSLKNTDTGEELQDIGGEIPSFDEEYVAISLGMWPDGFEYPEHLEVTVRIGCESGSELITYDLEMPEPLKARVYEMNELIEHRGQKITVDRVTVYPTCTYVEYSEDSDNDMDIIDIDFHLVDENGIERGQERMITYWDDNGMYIASGYFALEGDVSLVLDKLYLLPKEKRTVKYNMNTKEFHDCDGVLDYIRYLDESDPIYQDYMKDEEVIGFVIEREDVQASCSINQFSITESGNDESENPWFGELLIDDVVYYTMPKTIEVDENGEVTLYRQFAEYFDEPNIVIPVE